MTPLPLLLLFDAVGWLFIGLQLSAPIAFLAFAGSELFARGGAWALVLASPFLYLGAALSFCAALFAIRLFLPAVREGEFPFPNHAVSRAWAIRLQYGRLPRMAGVRTFFMGSNTLRFFFLRALGVKNSFHIFASFDVDIMDHAMIEIDERAMIGGYTLIAGHLIDAGLLVLRKTTIGAGTQVLAGALVGPGCRIADEVHVGPMSRLFGNTVIGSQAYIGYEATIEVDCRIGDYAIIGNRAVIESRCVIGEGAIIAPDTIVPKGTRIADGARYPEKRA